MGTLAPNPSVKMHGYDLMSRILGHIDIIRTHIHTWRQACNGLSYFLFRLVSNLLPDNL